MATQRQKKLAKAIVENAVAEKPKGIGQILENIGYSKNTAEAIPGEIIAAKGVQEELITLGFTEDNAKSVVSEIMLNPEAEDNNRLKAADMVFKVKGGYAPDKSINVNVSVLDDNAIDEIAKRLNNEMTNEVHKGNGIGGNGEIPSVVVEEIRDENGEGSAT
jgi:Flp pilus assembly CpaF family ATPase